MTSDKDKSMRGGAQTGSSAQTGPYRGRIGDLDLLFASEEDFLKADRVWRESTGGQGGDVLSAKDVLSVKDCVASYLKLDGIRLPQRQGRRRTNGSGGVR
jgi:hypothetical protein